MLLRGGWRLGWLTGFIELVTTAIANAQARVELRGYAEEQAALRPAVPEPVEVAV